MSDEIREFLRQAAGPEERVGPDIERLVRRSRQRRFARAAAGVVALVAIAALGVTQLPQFAPVDPVVEPVPGPHPSSAASPSAVAPGDAALRFTFTGEEGADGCRYDGPTRVIAGSHRVELADRTAAQEGQAGIDGLADGYGIEDVVQSMSDARTEPPYRFDSRSEHPWRPEPATSFGLEGLRIVQGGDVDAGEVTLPPGRHVLYCAVERKANFLWDLWPVGELTVVEQP